jgi:ferric-dicitrate binding protein FerR (iron transport regulator)
LERKDRARLAAFTRWNNVKELNANAMQMLCKTMQTIREDIRREDMRGEESKRNTITVFLFCFFFLIHV